MRIKQAALPDLGIVENITNITISEIYPHYYPPGAVKFFLQHHSEQNICSDIKKKRVFLLIDTEENTVGTVTIKENEICRLFVLPQYQGNGYGTRMLDFAEKSILQHYPEIELAASFPAKGLYIKRGYKEDGFHMISTEYNDVLCYDVMIKRGTDYGDY